MADAPLRAEFCRLCSVFYLGNVPNECVCKPKVQGKKDCFGYISESPGGGGCDRCKDNKACENRQFEIGEELYYHNFYDTKVRDIIDKRRNKENGHE